MKQIVKVLVTRSGDNWIASTQGLPNDKQAMALGRTWKQTKAMIQDSAERALGVPPGTVEADMELENPELQKLIEDVRQRKAVLRDAEFEAGAAMGLAARTLTRQATVRDVAEMLGCSHQYVSKLAPKSSS
jgi:hypothetical protein